MESTEKKGGCDKHGECPRCKCRSDKKLNVYDWLQDIPESHQDTEFVEVQFKNTRKGYFRNSNKLQIEKGDIVAVESNPGHDIGEITLTGRLVLLQMKKNNVRLDNPDIRRVYRKAKPTDLEKYEEAKAREHDTMLRARKIAEDLKLNMKIGDVEYQGDGNKAIFYYIADDRVDFRQLIKVLADAFRVRIEMKQIGARQEAGRIGGIGPCGRELCCSGWMTSFISVATSAARYQDISLNPQKLAGQCAKLKCCLNYEVDTYVEAQKKLPSREIVLETKDSAYFHFKTDIHRRMISYSTSRDFPANLITIPASRAFEIIALNKRGIRVETLEGENKPEAPKKEFSDVVGQDSLTRFDKTKKNNNNNKKRSRRGNRPDDQATNGTNQPEANGQETNRQPNRQREDRRPNPGKERPNKPQQQGTPNDGNRPQQRGPKQPQQSGQRPPQQQGQPNANQSQQSGKQEPQQNGQAGGQGQKKPFKKNRRPQNGERKNNNGQEPNNNSNDKPAKQQKPKQD
ncbi:MAG: regulatory iron-sulfur-containing complex subunit RicT [Bacteroidales bacterium]